MFRFVPHAESKVRRMMRPYRAFETTKKKKVEQKSQRNYGIHVKLSIKKELSKISYTCWLAMDLYIIDIRIKPGL